MAETPILLALETSTSLGSVAVGAGGELLAEVTLGVHSRAAESLLPAVDFALRSAGLEPAGLDGVVVGGGPGSFTGIRIAAATGKGLVRSLGLPLYAYSGLLAVAAGAAGAGSPVCALFDARRGEVYAGCYGFPGLASIDTLLVPSVMPVEELVGSLGAEPLYAGEGAQLHRGLIEDAGGRVAPPHVGLPRAAALLWLAGLDREAGRVEDPSAWEPEYLRPWGAERAPAE